LRQDVRIEWIEAVNRLARADAVVAVFDGDSQAVPVEAALAQQMDVPLLVIAGIGTDSTAQFERSGFRVIDVQRGRDAIQQALHQVLLGGSRSAPATSPMT